MPRLDSLKVLMPQLPMSKIQKGKFRLWAAVTIVLWVTHTRCPKSFKVDSEWKNMGLSTIIKQNIIEDPFKSLSANDWSSSLSTSESGLYL